VFLAHYLRNPRRATQTSGRVVVVGADISERLRRAEVAAAAGQKPAAHPSDGGVVGGVRCLRLQSQQLCGTVKVLDGTDWGKVKKLWPFRSV
jgi:hypothetical protein